MAESKYAKYVIPAPITQSPFKQIDLPMVLGGGKEHLGGFPFTMAWALITEPFVMVEHAHSHIYSQVLLFIGGDVQNINEFDAELWMHFGEEQERFVITSPTMVLVMGGMVHCPLVIHRVGKPFQYMDLIFTAEIAKHPIPKASQR